MLIRIVRMTFREDQTAAFLEIFRAAQPKIRAFVGCQHLELWQDAQAPHIFSTYSHWDSEAALNNYRHSGLFAGVWSETKKLFGAPPLAFSSVVYVAEQPVTGTRIAE